MYQPLIRNCIYAVLLAFGFNVILSPFIIPILRKIKLGQYIRGDGPQSHLKKEGTPTMGGILILCSFIFAGLFFIEHNPDVIAILATTLGFGLIGFLDDYLKVVLKRSLGLRAYQKIFLQLAVTILFILYLVKIKGVDTDIVVPFFRDVSFYLNGFYIPFCIFVMIGAVNSVNLTDGLDGLAAGVTILVSTFFATVSLSMFPEISPIICTIIGSLLGFMLFNAFPAKIFMGDTGSLALGGFLAALSIIMKLPLFLAIVGIIYVAESMSDILQVTFYKLFKKRIFKMAPIHHHFEILGWKETKVVAVFFIITAIACLIGFLGI